MVLLEIARSTLNHTGGHRNNDDPRHALESADPPGKTLLMLTAV